MKQKITTIAIIALIIVAAVICLNRFAKAEDMDFFAVDSGILEWEGTAYNRCLEKYQEPLSNKKWEYLQEYYDREGGYPSIIADTARTATFSLMYYACVAKANANREEDICESACYEQEAARLLEVDRDCVDGKDCKDSVRVPAEEIRENCLGRCRDPEYELKPITSYERKELMSGNWDASLRRLCFSKDCYTLTGSCKQACSPPKKNEIAPLSNYEELKEQGRLILASSCRCMTETEHGIVHRRPSCKIGTAHHDDPTYYVRCFQCAFEGDLGASTLWHTVCDYALYLITETTVDPEQFLKQPDFGDDSEKGKTPPKKDLTEQFKKADTKKKPILTGKEEYTEQERAKIIMDVFGIDINNLPPGEGRKAYIVYSESMDWYRNFWVEGVTNQSITAIWLLEDLGYNVEVVYAQTAEEAFDYMIDPNASAIFNFAHQRYCSIEEVTPDKLSAQYKQALIRLLYRKKYGKEAKTLAEIRKKIGDEKTKEILEEVEKIGYDSLNKDLFINFSCHSLDDLGIIERTVKPGGIYFGHEGTLYPTEILEREIRR